MFLQPSLEREQSGQRFPVPLTIGRLFAVDDVIDVSDWQSMTLDAPLPRILERSMPSGGEAEPNLQQCSRNLLTVLLVLVQI
jgi:hypothetical protein